MRKFIFALMASLLSCSSVSAFWQEAVESSLKIGVGYRQDNTKWKRERSPSTGSDYYSGDYYSSYSDSDKAKIKSSLEWKNLDIWLIEGSGKYTTCDNVYLRGCLDYGWITSGKIKRKEELADFSDSLDISFNGNHHHVKGNVWDAKLAVGYQFKWCDEALSLAPVVGYSWHGTELKNGNDYYSSSYDYYYDSDYYDSYYSSGNRQKIHQRWVGPFVGIDFDYRLCCDWNLFLSYEYHWADYHAKVRHGEFNNDFADVAFADNNSRIHGKNGSGNILDFGVKWDLCDCWTVGLRGEFAWWEACHAHEHRKVFECSDTSDLKIETILKTKIKEVTWNSSKVVLDFGMVF